MEETFTDIFVSLLRMTWRRWGGSMGGALRCSSGLQMYCSCPYGPGGELDRSARAEMIIQTDSALLFLLKVTLFEWLTWCVRALQRVHLQRIKHLKVWLLHLDEVIDGAELTGHSWLLHTQPKEEVLELLTSPWAYFSGLIETWTTANNKTWNIMKC